MALSSIRPLAIYYEHPDWFRPLFTELEQRGTPHVRLDASCHAYDAAELPPPYSLVFNRMRDRKSTRLNSSHPSISYAVFCLKKKKQQKQGDNDTKHRQ